MKIALIVIGIVLLVLAVGLFFMGTNGHVWNSTSVACSKAVEAQAHVLDRQMILDKAKGTPKEKDEARAVETAESLRKFAEDDCSKGKMTCYLLAGVSGLGLLMVVGGFLKRKKGPVDMSLS